MTTTRALLEQLDKQVFLTDGGLETTLIFHEGIELPYFAAFDLIRHRKGKGILRAYYRRYLDIARSNDAGFILESPTWRANKDWGALLGYSDQSLKIANQECIKMLDDVRRRHGNGQTPVLISGCVGPRGDGYAVDKAMTAEEAESYHADQIGTFSKTAADLVTALTMTNSSEAIGIVRAAKAVGMPVVIAFTVETDGLLPSGETLRGAILKTDAETGAASVFYMINCAHPTHFEGVLSSDESWVQRVRGIRANASKCSHAELDEATELDDGNPVELGVDFGRIKGVHAQMRVFGGCCGTDHRHIGNICQAVVPNTKRAA